MPLNACALHQYYCYLYSVVAGYSAADNIHSTPPSVVWCPRCSYSQLPDKNWHDRNVVCLSLNIGLERCLLFFIFLFWFSWIPVFCLGKCILITRLQFHFLIRKHLDSLWNQEKVWNQMMVSSVKGSCICILPQPMQSESQTNYSFELVLFKDSKTLNTCWQN